MHYNSIICNIMSKSLTANYILVGLRSERERGIEDWRNNIFSVHVKLSDHKQHVHGPYGTTIQKRNIINSENLYIFRTLVYFVSELQRRYGSMIL